ncbi:TonB-dependent receptor plug domain-containing protein [Eudoraea chungangensis]|uniref:TonB-dependent receptor plug domain-containing protein n=1 Tax=Eudoraea chungangensis TaxID=1481905 RepID=UPI0023EDF1D0|nr:TonB-dependent receptor [Eudoraea chungangensis]
MNTEFIYKVFGYLVGGSLRNTVALVLLCTFATAERTTAQEPIIDNSIDSILPINLQEVIVISSYKKDLEHSAHAKPLSTLDEYLEASNKVSLIKRGAYAWEPMLNDMSTERLSVTIDGMRIFGACTDKMDPITSYVDVSNLSEVQILGGQQGAEHGTTIGGSIDMQLEKSNFNPTDWQAAIETGGEANNAARIIGGELNYSDEKFYVDTDIIYRKAENYVAGGGEEVAYSQYEKYNFSINGGVKISNSQKLLGSFIFDEARDIGYPALPMDVSLAQAFIGSISYLQDFFIGRLTDWETKLYANSITHIMDDSQRLDVPIRMDMPGWSDTYGFYSQSQLKHEDHRFLFKLDGFYNRSLAEMTMYPNNSEEREMFMLTWPDVRSINTGFYAEDVLSFENSYLKFSTRFAFQSFNVASEMGLNSLRIFYPDMEQRQTRILKSVAARYRIEGDNFQFTGGLSYGDRAPSVSEGFGFYLYNSFDNHDYIGNPDLKNESAIEVNASFVVPINELKIAMEGNYFHTLNFILGEVNPELSVMTIGADGVKVYKNLLYANLYNISLNATYQLSNAFSLSGNASYHRGTDQDGENLPFISPFTYASTLAYTQEKLIASFTVNGAADQVNFNPDFGEDRTDAYTIFSLAVGRNFKINEDKLYIKAGVENVFDTNYSTYTDWNNIPRMGRNFFAAITYSFN